MWDKMSPGHFLFRVLSRKSGANGHLTDISTVVSRALENTRKRKVMCPAEIRTEYYRKNKPGALLLEQSCSLIRYDCLKLQSVA